MMSGACAYFDIHTSNGSSGSDLQPATDERLEHAADVQLRAGHEWLARFYVGRMHRPPLMPRMRRFWAEERARLGLPPLEPSTADDGGSGSE